VHRAFVLGELAGAAVYVVHLSAADALEEVRLARARGVRAFAETCPQYLELDESELARPNFEGARFVCSPPLRARENLPPLWEGLADGSLQVLATDHAPFTWEDRQRGRNDFTKIPNGLATIEHRVTIGYQGVVRGLFGLERFVEVIATGPARMFGLPAKGTLEPGADGDVVVFDPDVEWTISAANQHMAVDDSVFEGKRVQGRPEIVIRRGEVLVDGDGWHEPASRGRFLTRGAFRD
jgi:dihydropyrimidinase